MAPISFSVHPYIRNKPKNWEPQFATGWTTRTGELEELRDQITSGGAFICAEMSSSARSSAAFLHADIAAVDVDHGLTIEQFKSLPLASYAALLYTTASHDPGNGKHRFRIIFLLPERISNPRTYKAITTLLTEAVGGDRACTDPCRLFYGNDAAEVPIWNPAADRLPDALVEDAERKAIEISLTPDAIKSSEYDPETIGRAIFVLEQILDPTSDGERDLFVRITAAAASGGSALFPAWSDWASRGHHGKGKNSKQTTLRFFQGFSGKSTSLGTLFFLANKQHPEWRDQLPDELKSSGGSWSMAPEGSSAYGYDQEAFMGYGDAYLDELLDPEPQRGKSVRTQSLFDDERPWAIVPTTTPIEVLPAAALGTDEDDEDVDPEFMHPGFDLGDCVDNPNVGVAPRHTGVVSPTRPMGPEDEPTTQAELIRYRVVKRFPGLRLNTMTQILEYGPKDAPLVVPDPSTLYLPLSKGLPKLLPKVAVFDACTRIGQENTHNPVVRYLEQCASEAPCAYFDQLATELVGIPELASQHQMPCGQVIPNVILRRFCIAAVARALDPGCQVSWMPILVGAQSVGKSNFFSMLAPIQPGAESHPWVTTIQQGIATLREKPHTLHAGWIVVLDEAERYFHRRNVEELKNLVTISHDRSAKKYENEKLFPRAFVLAGATNSADFFVDPTGNRRFLPISVQGLVPAREDPSIRIIDLDRLKRDQNSIWAAAYHAYRAGEPWDFSSYEISLMTDYLDSFRADSPIDLAVASVVSTRNSGVTPFGVRYVTLVDIFQWMGIPVDRHTQMTRPITDALKRMGYQLGRFRNGGRVIRAWVEPGLRK